MDPAMTVEKLTGLIPEETKETLIKDVQALKDLETVSRIQKRINFGHTDTLAITMTPDGDLMYANPAWYQYLGLRAEDMIGKNFKDFLHPDDCYASIVVARKGQLGEIKSVGFRNRYRSSSGRYVGIRWMGGTYDPESGLWYAQSFTSPMPYWLQLFRKIQTITCGWRESGS